VDVFFSPVSLILTFYRRPSKILASFLSQNLLPCWKHVKTCAWMTLHTRSGGPYPNGAANGVRTQIRIRLRVVRREGVILNGGNSVDCRLVRLTRFPYKRGPDMWGFTVPLSTFESFIGMTPTKLSIFSKPKCSPSPATKKKREVMVHHIWVDQIFGKIGEESILLSVDFGNAFPIKDFLFGNFHLKRPTDSKGKFLSEWVTGDKLFHRLKRS
jgi:hypothetical protein